MDIEDFNISCVNKSELFSSKISGCDAIITQGHCAWHQNTVVRQLVAITGIDNWKHLPWKIFKHHCSRMWQWTASRNAYGAPFFPTWRYYPSLAVSLQLREPPVLCCTRKCCPTLKENVGSKDFTKHMLLPKSFTCTFPSKPITVSKGITWNCSHFHGDSRCSHSLLPLILIWYVVKSWLHSPWTSDPRSKFPAWLGWSYWITVHCQKWNGQMGTFVLTFHWLQMCWSASIWERSSFIITSQTWFIQLFL